MESLLDWIYNLPISTAIRVDYFWFPFIESIHVVAITLVVGSISIVDIRLLGITSNRKSVSELMHELLPWTWGCFILAAITGTFMFMSKAPDYYHNGDFQYMMIFIALAGINMAIFHLSPTYRNVRSWDQGVPPPVMAKIAGGVSLALWFSVVAFGRWIGYTMM